VEFNLGILKKLRGFIKTVISQDVLDKIPSKTEHKTTILKKNIPEWFLLYIINILNIQAAVEL
jgi:hypothetical protein